MQSDAMALASLDVSDNRLSGRASHALFAALDANTALTTLNLEHTELPPAAVDRLAVLLRENVTLRTVRLDPHTVHALREVTAPPFPLRRWKSCES
jgi:hypothetical protein